MIIRVLDDNGSIFRDSIVAWRVNPELPLIDQIEEELLAHHCSETLFEELTVHRLLSLYHFCCPIVSSSEHANDAPPNHRPPSFEDCEEFVRHRRGLWSLLDQIESQSPSRELNDTDTLISYVMTELRTIPINTLTKALGSAKQQQVDGYISLDLQLTPNRLGLRAGSVLMLSPLATSSSTIAHPSEPPMPPKDATNYPRIFNSFKIPQLVVKKKEGSPLSPAEEFSAPVMTDGRAISHERDEGIAFEVTEPFRHERSETPNKLTLKLTDDNDNDDDSDTYPQMVAPISLEKLLTKLVTLARQPIDISSKRSKLTNLEWLDGLTTSIRYLLRKVKQTVTFTEPITLIIESVLEGLLRDGRVATVASIAAQIDEASRDREMPPLSAQSKGSLAQLTSDLLALMRSDNPSRTFAARNMPADYEEARHLSNTTNGTRWVTPVMMGPAKANQAEESEEEMHSDDASVVVEEGPNGRRRVSHVDSEDDVMDFLGFSDPSKMGSVSPQITVPMEHPTRASVDHDVYLWAKPSKYLRPSTPRLRDHAEEIQSSLGVTSSKLRKPLLSESPESPDESHGVALASSPWDVVGSWTSHSPAYKEGRSDERIQIPRETPQEIAARTIEAVRKGKQAVNIALGHRSYGGNSGTDSDSKTPSLPTSKMSGGRAKAAENLFMAGFGLAQADVPSPTPPIPYQVNPGNSKYTIAPTAIRNRSVSEEQITDDAFHPHDKGFTQRREPSGVSHIMRPKRKEVSFADQRDSLKVALKRYEGGGVERALWEKDFALDGANLNVGGQHISRPFRTNAQNITGSEAAPLQHHSKRHRHPPSRLDAIFRDSLDNTILSEARERAKEDSDEDDTTEGFLLPRAAITEGSSKPRSSYGAQRTESPQLDEELTTVISEPMVGTRAPTRKNRMDGMLLAPLRKESLPHYVL